VTLFAGGYIVGFQQGVPSARGRATVPPTKAGKGATVPHGSGDVPSGPPEGESAPRPAEVPNFEATVKASRWPFTATRAVKEQDLRPLALDDLRVMRNEIYARHGYVFLRDEDPDLVDYFARQPWYQPKGPPEDYRAVNKRATDETTELERWNAGAIVVHERRRRAASR
jgi:hypothetical protein